MGYTLGSTATGRYMNVKNLDVYIGWILGFIITTLINWWLFPWFYDYFQELLRGF